jgi:hypothetical protein
MSYPKTGIYNFWNRYKAAKLVALHLSFANFRNWPKADKRAFVCVNFEANTLAEGQGAPDCSWLDVEMSNWY